MSIREIGCCGAYCRTCLAAGTQCRGCKSGYETGKRDINKSRCKIKICCFRDRQLETCADCRDYATCDIINGLYRKNGYKYRKYKEALDFIKQHGYPLFIDLADEWNGPYGKLY